MARPNEWRDSARTVRFFVFDALTGIPFILTLAHLRWWSVGFALTTFLVFGFLGRKGYSPRVALRLIRGWLAGPVSFGRPWWQRPQGRY